jgi:large subunit ribosomal protein L22
MEVKAYTKYNRMSPKKVRQVAREIQGMEASQALNTLQVIPRKSARLISKTLKSAMANAENNFDLNPDDLVVSEAIVEEGPAFRRFQPCARGSAHPYKKRTCHIRITLSE